MTRRLLHLAAIPILLAAPCAARAADAQSNQPVAVPPVAPTRHIAAKARALDSPGVHAAAPAAPKIAAKPAEPAPTFVPPPQESLPLGRSVPRAAAARPDSAALSTESDPVRPTGGITTGSWIFQTAAALAVVIGLIVALRTWLQKLAGRGGMLGSRLVEVIGRSSIGPRTQVLFLRINRRVVVVGQTPAGLSPLTTLEDPDDVAWLVAQVQASRPLSVTAGFRHLMQRFESDHAAAEEGGDTAEQSVDRTRDRLSGLIARIRAMKNQPPGDRGGER